MKRFAWMSVLAVTAMLLPALPVRAEDALTLPVVDQEGNEYDLIEESDGDALVVFVDADKLEEDDVDQLAEAVEALANGDEGDDDDAMATLRQHGLLRLADEDDDEGEAEGEDWNFVFVVLGAAEDWEDIEAELGEVPDDVEVVLADPESDALEAWELPDDLVWAAYLVEDGEIVEGYETVEALEGAAGKIEADVED